MKAPTPNMFKGEVAVVAPCGTHQVEEEGKVQLQKNAAEED